MFIKIFLLQFSYGEDGKDVMKAQFLKKKQIPFLADNCKAVLNVPITDLEDSEVSELIEKRKKEVRLNKSSINCTLNSFY